MRLHRQQAMYITFLMQHSVLLLPREQADRQKRVGNHEWSKS